MCGAEAIDIWRAFGLAHMARLPSTLNKGKAALGWNLEGVRRWNDERPRPATRIVPLCGQSQGRRDSAVVSFNAMSTCAKSLRKSANERVSRDH